MSKTILLVVTPLILCACEAHIKEHIELEFHSVFGMNDDEQIISRYEVEPAKKNYDIGLKDLM